MCYLGTEELDQWGGGEALSLRVSLLDIAYQPGQGRAARQPPVAMLQIGVDAGPGESGLSLNGTGVAVGPGSGTRAMSLCPSHNLFDGQGHGRHAYAWPLPIVALVKSPVAV